MIKTKKDKIHEIDTKNNVKARILLPKSWLSSTEFFHKAVVLIKNTVEFH